ncbi:HAD family phosphatase [Paenibacillus donghaensis]|uniref:Cof-type HAD-IIB family hydrolase n=1 Tax=Paenibacillus donghaensis TaxID=414771 RepID=UPI00188447C0|nr:Cof-type HAD-IIB family hydrolase [Paenibacillus donghaensis]MBE9916134.1 HAD family phosphatase [Paenibacillus donghaensis]
MAVKAVFSDIDGTLLNSEHQITPGTKQAVQKITEAGIPFVLVSARMPSGILNLQKQLGISSPMVCFSGALVLDASGSADNPVIHSAEFPQDAARRITSTVKENFPNISMSLYYHDSWMVSDIQNHWVVQEKEITNARPEPIDLASYIESGFGVHKILCMGDPQDIDRLRQSLQSEITGVSIYKSKDTYLEMMAEAASKSHAVQILIDRLGISREEVMAVGDHYNDIDMLSFAGVGVAMGNAPEEVKRNADQVTLRNDEDGLKYCLEKYVISL